MRAILVSLTLLPVLAAAAPPRPERTYDLEDVNWRVRILPETYRIEGTVVNTVRVFDDAKTLRFDCQKLTINEVTVDGRAQGFSTDGSSVIVRMGRPVVKGHAAKVLIRYHGQPEAGVYFIDAAHASPAKTPMVYTQGEMEDNRNWLPTYDYPDDKATSSGTLEVPKGWKTLSNGRLVSQESKGDFDVFHWKMDQPHSTYLISFVAGPFSETFSSGARVPVSAFVPKGLEDWGDVAFGGTAENVSFYEKLTGVNYPWAKYSQAAVSDFMFGGMENVTCTTQTIETLHPKSLDGVRSSRELVAHELAHQWFGDLITAQDWSHIWVNEGWATFLPPFFTREKAGQDAYDLERLDILAGSLDAIRGAGRSMVWSGYTDPIDAFDGNAYSGGAARMFMLMHQVGEAAFWKATAKYLDEYRFKNVTTEDFFRSFSASLGINLDSFRKQWFYISGAPKLTLAKEGSQWVVRQGEPAFDLTLETLEWKDGKAIVVSQPISGPRTVLASTADAVVLDPGAWLMTDIQYDVNYPVERWLALYAASPNVAGKARLTREFFNRLTPDQEANMFANERSKALREKLVGLLRNSAVVLDAANSPDDALRLAAVNRLDQLPLTPQAVARLRDMAKTDNDDIALAATRALVHSSKAPELLDSAWNRDSFQDGFRRFALTTWQGTSPDRARTLALSVLATPQSEQLRVDAIGVLGQLKDKPGEKVVLEALKAVLAEHTFGARSAAIRALGQYGSKASIDLIRPFEKHPLSFFRGAAREALGVLGAH